MVPDQIGRNRKELLGEIADIAKRMMITERMMPNQFGQPAYINAQKAKDNVIVIQYSRKLFFSIPKIPAY
jgi:hypothetical protein